ncbi:MAG TPA: hypothetical protein VH740_06300 [Vicinamibacterales bacterium]
MFELRHVLRATGRTIAAALFGAFAGAAWLALMYGSSPALRIDFDVTPPPRQVQGVYTAERDPDSERTFAWTADTMTVELDDVDRQVDWAMELSVRGARAEGPQPELQFFVDGVPVLTHASTRDFATVRVSIPRRSQSGVTIAMRASSTFVPGPGDSRRLGAMVDWITLTPGGVILPPVSAIAGVAMGSAAAAAAIALLGVTAGTAVGAAIVLGAALAALVARGFGPYTDFAQTLARCALWVGVATAALTAIARGVRGQPFKNTAKFAIAFSGAVLLLELLVLLHPDMPIGDALFQAHRFQDVLAGKLYFTSLAPGNYQFPYPPGLYIVAMPFARLVRRGASDMTLLRTIVCSADVLAALLLYNLAVRIRGDRLAGALAVATYHLIPLGFAVVTTGNLTNAFAQSLSVVAFALIAGSAVRRERAAAVLVLAIALTGASLSHTSAFAIVSTAAITIALLFWLRGGPALRSPAIAVMAATAIAIAAAVAIYYAHFMDTYRTELARIGTETATAAPDAGGRTIGERLGAVPRYLNIYFGVPVLFLAGWGAVELARRGARDRVTLTAAGWALACAVFFAIGILTPVDMRYYLAVIPSIAIAAAVGGAIAWTAGGRRRVIAAVVFAWMVADAVRAWWSNLG